MFQSNLQSVSVKLVECFSQTCRAFQSNGLASAVQRRCFRNAESMSPQCRGSVSAVQRQCLRSAEVSLCFASSKEVGEVFVVEGRETCAIVNGLAHDKHGGEGEVVVVNNLCEVFEYAAIDLLIGPGQMIAGSNGGVLRVFLKQLALHIIDDGSREEDTHGRL